MPTPLSVLMRETMQVMKSDSSKGVTQRALRAGSLAKPKRVRDEDFEEFIDVSISRPVKAPFPQPEGRRENTRPAWPAVVGALIDVNAYGNS
jgi:hypothetical protein